MKRLAIVAVIHSIIRLFDYSIIPPALAYDDAERARFESWTNAPLGIAITMCDHSTRGVFVRFETDLEPPYYVGIYRPDEESLGRRFPVAEIETMIKQAYIPGNFSDVTLFVQVYDRSVVEHYAAQHGGRRTMTKAEVDDYVSTIRNAKPYINSDASVTFETSRENSLEVVDDYTWAGFVKTDATNLTFTLRGEKWEADPDAVETNVTIAGVVQDIIYTNISTTVSGTNVYVSTYTGRYETRDLSMTNSYTVSTNHNTWGGCDYTVSECFKHATHNDHAVLSTNVSHSVLRPVPHEYSFNIRDGQVDVGTGYRIMMFEDSGVCQAQRAYSARTNMSDSVVLPSGFRALSSHNGYIYTTDWHGRRYFQKTTNRVDHIIK